MFLETLIEPVAHYQENPFTAAPRAERTRKKTLRQRERTRLTRILLETIEPRTGNGPAVLVAVSTAEKYIWAASSSRRLHEKTLPTSVRRAIKRRGTPRAVIYDNGWKKNEERQVCEGNC